VWQVLTDKLAQRGAMMDATGNSRQLLVGWRCELVIYEKEAHGIDITSCIREK